MDQATMKPVYIRRYRSGVWGFLCCATSGTDREVDFWCADAARTFATQSEALAFGLAHVKHHDPHTGELVPTVDALMHLTFP